MWRMTAWMSNTHPHEGKMSSLGEAENFWVERTPHCLSRNQLPNGNFRSNQTYNSWQLGSLTNFNQAWIANQDSFAIHEEDDCVWNQHSVFSPLNWNLCSNRKIHWYPQLIHCQLYPKLRFEKNDGWTWQACHNFHCHELFQTHCVVHINSPWKEATQGNHHLQRTPNTCMAAHTTGPWALELLFVR